MKNGTWLSLVSFILFLTRDSEFTGRALWTQSLAVMNELGSLEHPRQLYSAQRN